MLKGRVNPGDLLAAAGGVLLYLSLGLDWFSQHTLPGETPGATADAREVFANIDMILTVVAAIAVALLVIALLAGGRLAEGWSFITALAGGVAAPIVLVRLVAQPSANETVDVESGAWLGLFMCILIGLGGWMAMRAERSSGRREPAGATRT